MKILYVPATLFFLYWFVTGSSLAGELSPLFPGYPEVFDVNGSLDLKGKNRIVINDNNYLVTSSTSYHNPSGPTSLAAFSEKDQVGALLLAESTEIKSLWLLKGAAPVIMKKSEEKTPSTLTHENGVWKN